MSAPPRLFTVGVRRPYSPCCRHHTGARVRRWRTRQVIHQQHPWSAPFLLSSGLRDPARAVVTPSLKAHRVASTSSARLWNGTHFTLEQANCSCLACQPRHRRLFYFYLCFLRFHLCACAAHSIVLHSPIPDLIIFSLPVYKSTVLADCSESG
jgi:hypothetical protein